MLTQTKVIVGYIRRGGRVHPVYGVAHIDREKHSLPLRERVSADGNRQPTKPE